MFKNLSVHMLKVLFLWWFQITSPGTQINGQVEFMKEHEAWKGSPLGKLSLDIFLKQQTPSCKGPWSISWHDVFVENSV